MKKLIAVFALIVSTSAWAGVPHIFQSGQKAVAAEVNENFDYLDKRIDSIGNNGNNVQIVDYSPKDVQAGDSVVIGSTVFTVDTVTFSWKGKEQTLLVPLDKEQIWRVNNYTPEDATQRISLGDIKIVVSEITNISVKVNGVEKEGDFGVVFVSLMVSGLFYNTYTFNTPAEADEFVDYIRKVE